jgi:NADH dehydrogenase
MASRIVTVFGGSGFLGRHVVRCLAKDGWRIRVAVRHPNLAEFLRPAGMVGQVQPFKADVSDLMSVRAATLGAEAVVNLVATMRGGFAGNRFTAINQDGARNVAVGAGAGGAGGPRQLVHVSALGASSESTSGYARSKAAGEAGVREAFPAATILRPSVVFGPEDQFFNRFANMARYTLALPLIGGGGTRFQPVYVGDVATAVRMTLDGTKDDGGLYELGGPEILTFKEVMEMVLRVTMRRRLLVPLPFFLASAISYPLSLLPNAPLTPDQVRLLRGDSVVAEGAKGFADLGITPVSPEAQIPAYLWRFRRSGQFEAAAH